MPTIPFEKIESYLQRHKGGIEGVVITGGEPTIHADLPYLCGRLKKLGFDIKLDTNGTNPSMTSGLIEESLVDYVAMDIKAPLTVERYLSATGVDSQDILETIEESMSIIMESKIDYEFRTTLVPTIHAEEDVKEISKAVGGCRRYVLQNFKSEVKMIDPSFEGLKPFSRADMESFLKAARTYVEDVKIRG